MNIQSRLKQIIKKLESKYNHEKNIKNKLI